MSDGNPNHTHLPTNGAMQGAPASVPVASTNQQPPPHDNPPSQDPSVVIMVAPAAGAMAGPYASHPYQIPPPAPPQFPTPGPQPYFPFVNQPVAYGAPQQWQYVMVAPHGPQTHAPQPQHFTHQTVHVGGAPVHQHGTHPMSRNPSHPGKGNTVSCCRFLSGTCKFGTKCWYPHGDSPMCQYREQCRHGHFRRSHETDTTPSTPSAPPD